MYLNEEITANFPPDTPNEISYEMIGNYLDDSVVLTEGASAFPEDTYRKTITLLALDSWIKALELQPQTGKIITEENGFSSEQILSLIHIYTNVDEKSSGEFAGSLLDILVKLCDVLGLIVLKKEEALDSDVYKRQGKYREGGFKKAL